VHFHAKPILQEFAARACNNDFMITALQTYFQQVLHDNIVDPTTLNHGLYELDNATVEHKIPEP